MSNARQQEISNLPFTDLYLNLQDPTVAARYRPDPLKSKESGNLTVPADFVDEIDAIRNMLNLERITEGTLTYKGLRLRYARFTAAENEEWAAIRAVPLDLPDLDRLGFTQDFVRMIRGWGHKKGMILVGGKTGDGKTTTCIATLKDYLEKKGGLLYSVEDPIEYQMQGAISQKGFCLQYEVKDEEDWNPAIKRAMRCRPDYILIGEIRSAAAAENLLKAATSGHLVFATIHAGNVADTIQAVLHLAENRLGPVARQIVADRLVAAIYQTLTPAGPRIECVVPQPGPDDMVAKAIKSGNVANLQNQVKRFPDNRK